MPVEPLLPPFESSAFAAADDETFAEGEGAVLAEKLKPIRASFEKRQTATPFGVSVPSRTVARVVVAASHLKPSLKPSEAAILNAFSFESTSW